MDENIKDLDVEVEQTSSTEKIPDDLLQEAIKAEMKKVQMAALLSGSKAICGVVLQYIVEFNQKPGKKTYRDYERLVKKIVDFCSVSIDREVNENGEIVEIKREEAVNNDPDQVTFDEVITEED